MAPPLSLAVPAVSPPGPSPRRPPFVLANKRDFVRLWSAFSVSILGAEFARISAMLLLVGALRASPFEVGMAGTLEFLPILFAPLAGVWFDQAVRRRLLVGAEWGRAAVLLALALTIPLIGLGLAPVYVTLFVLGALGMIHEIAFQAYLPQVVPQNRLIEANGRIVLSEYAASALGAGVGATVLGYAGGTAAFAACAAAFLTAGLLLKRTGSVERRPAPRQGRTFTRQDIAEGFRLIISNPLLRTLAWGQSLVTLSVYAYFALPVLFMSRQLALSDSTIGLVSMLGGGGALLSVLLLRRLLTRYGAGTLLVGAAAVMGLGIAVVASAGTAAVEGLGRPATIGTVALGVWMVMSAVTVFDAVEAGLRQASIPSALQGRVTAPMVMITCGTMPLGSICGGLLAQQLGVVRALLALAAFQGLAAVALFFSPVRRVRESVAPPL